jgi:hypothetical protein
LWDTEKPVRSRYPPARLSLAVITILISAAAMHALRYTCIHAFIYSCIGILIIFPNLAKQRHNGPLPRPEFLVGSLPKGIDFGFRQAEL